MARKASDMARAGTSGKEVKIYPTIASKIGKAENSVNRNREKLKNENLEMQQKISLHNTNRT